MTPCVPSLPIAIGVELLLALADRGVDVRVDPETFDLIVEPAHLVSAIEADSIALHFDGVLMAAVLNSEAGARVRRRVFSSADHLSNLLVPDAPYRRGVCFSCGAPSPPVGRRPSRCMLCRVGFLAATQLN